MTTINNSNQDVDEYIAEITAQYDAALKFIDALEEDTQAIARFTEEIRELSVERALGSRTAIAETDGCKAEQAELNADIAKQKANLEALDPSFKDIDNTMEAFLQTMNGLLSKDISASDMAGDMQQIVGYLNQLFSAMRQKLNADKDDAIISNDVQGKLSDAQLEQFAAQMISAEGDEQNTLGSLTKTMGDDYVTAHGQYDEANADHARFTIFDEIFGDADELEERDDQIMNNANAMMDGISDALDALTPEIATLMPEFVQIETILKSVMKRVQKILANINLSPNQKAGALLALMMFALGIFNMIGQEVQQEKARNEKKMADGNIAASRMNMDDTVMNQKIQEEEAAKAKLMQTIMMASQIILGGIMTLMAPGLGTALLMAAFTALEATGEMDKATQKLGEAIHSEIAAEVLIGVAEIVVTTGGGYVGDRMVAKIAQRVVENAVKTAEEAVAEAVERAAEQAAASVGKAGNAQAIADAKDAIGQVVKQAAETGAKRAAEQVANQPLLALFRLVSASGRDAARQVVAKAATEAAEIAVTASATVAKLAARGVTSSAAILTEIATRAGNRAAARIANVSEKDIEKAAQSETSKFTSRAGWTVAFNMTNSDYLIQLCETIQRARGKGHDRSFESFMTFVNVLKQFLQMIAMMGGAGMASSAILDGGAARATRIANGLSMLPQGANAIAAYGQTATFEGQATATTALAKNQTIADLLHTYLDQMQKDLSQERDRFIRQQQQELRSNEAMSGHLVDGDMAGIQVLMASAG